MASRNQPWCPLAPAWGAAPALGGLGLGARRQGPSVEGWAPQWKKPAIQWGWITGVIGKQACRWEVIGAGRVRQQHSVTRSLAAWATLEHWSNRTSAPMGLEERPKGIFP